MARGVGVGDYSRETIILNLSVRGGDYSRKAINRGTTFIRGLFCFGVMVEYDNPVTFELPRGLCYGEGRSSWLANGIGGRVTIICQNDWKVKALNVTDSLEFES